MRKPIVDQPPLPMSQSQRGRGQARVLQSIRIDPPGMAADGDADADEAAVAGEANAIELQIFDHSLNLIVFLISRTLHKMINDTI